MPELIPGSFWVTTQGHGVIPDGRRFLVVSAWGDGCWWVAWENGVAPLHMGTLLKEEHFQREERDHEKV